MKRLIKAQILKQPNGLHEYQSDEAIPRSATKNSDTNKIIVLNAILTAKQYMPAISHSFKVHHA
jgi:hypothetical protein